MTGAHGDRPALRPARAALAAAAVTALGQALLVWHSLPVPTELPRYRWGAGLLAGGALAFALASRRLPGTERPAPQPGDDDGAERPFAFGLAPAIALSFLNVLVLIANGESYATRWVWLASVLLVFLPLRSEWATRPRPRPAIVAALAITLAAAFALRAWDRARLPLAFHGDMAEMGLGGRALLHGEVQQFVSVGWASIPWVGFLPAALGLAVSDDLSGLRLAAAVLGAAGVAGVYFLGALLFGRRIGWIAAGVSAVGYAEIHFARLPAYGDPVPFVAFALYFLLRGLDGGSRLCFVAAGVLPAAASLLYYSGRVAPVLVAAVLLHALVTDRRRLRRRAGGLTTAALAALVTVAPMLLFYGEHPQELTSRQRDVSVFTPAVADHIVDAYHVTSLPRAIAVQVVRSALTFHHTPDTSLQFGFPRPMLNPFFGPLAALGLAVCAVRLRQAGPALLAAWWAFVLLVAGAFTSDAPFWPRLVVVLPAAALLVALGFDRVIDALAVASSRAAVSPRVRLAAGAVVVAGVGVVNWSWYTERARVYVDEADWLGRLIAAEPATRFCMVPGRLSFREEEVRFLAPGRDLLEVAPDGIAGCVAERRVVVVYPEQNDVLAAVRAAAPGAREVAHERPLGLRGPIFVLP